MAVRFLFVLLLLPFVSYAQIITRFAGGGTVLGDGGPATAAYVENPGGMAFDKNGNLYIASGVANRVRKIDTFGIITTFAGTGAGGFSGDGGAATAAKLNNPNDVSVDDAGNVYISDCRNNAIRKVDAATGKISTICGNGVSGVGGSSGDGGPATAAQIYGPNGVHVDKAGNIFVADCNNHRVRKINTAGIISTVAGTGVASYNGDGIAATAAQLYFPINIQSDDAGNLYISDAGNTRVRKVDAAGIITTIAGNGGATFSGDGIPATDAQILVSYIKFDMSGNLYITADPNHRVFKVDKGGYIYTIVGDGSPTNTGDGGPATAATINDPVCLAVDKCNNVYISLRSDKGIRKVQYNPNPCPKLGVEPVVEQKMSVYPNPAGDLLHVDNVNAYTTYKLVNVVGRVAQQGTLKIGSNSLSMQFLPAGMYLLDISGADGGRTVIKVVKD